jgi:hypothetical protein
MTWGVYIMGKDKHIVPEDECDDHSFTLKCPCQPKRDLEDPYIVTHNSYDGREAFERGERKPS